MGLSDYIFGEEVCAVMGHDWYDAGGGMKICGTCEAMQELDPEDYDDIDE